MASFTKEDLENADKFATAFKTIIKLQKTYKKNPHIVSWFDVQMRDASYPVPQNIKHMAKEIDVKMTKDLCELLNCDPMKEVDKCNPNEPASYYHVGENKYAVQCQPACFHTAAHVTYDKDGTRQMDTQMLRWNEYANVCRLINPSTHNWQLKPRYRSDVLYEMRKNDIQIGFNEIDDYTNILGSGVTYEMNKAYCEIYDREFDVEKKTCEMSTFDFVAGAILGNALINTVRSSVRLILNGSHPFNIPKYVIDLPKTMETKYTLDGWRNNINTNFVIPTIPIDPPNNNHLNRKKRSVNYNRKDSSSSLTPNDAIEQVKFDFDADKYKEMLMNLFIGLIKSLTDEDNLKQLGISMLVDDIISAVKYMSAKVIESMTPKVLEMMTKLIGEKIGIKVLETGMKTCITRSAIRIAFNMTSKLTIALARFASAAASVIGWILMISTLLDLIFAIWDPFGYNNLFPPELPGDLMRNGELSLRQILQRSETNFEFDHVMNVLLTQDEMFEIEVEALQYHIMYLNSLTVNSEGSVIDKGDEIELNGNEFNKDDMTNAATQGLTNRVKFDAQKYKDFNEQFLDRVKTNKFINLVVFGTFGLAATAILAKLYMISTLLIIICMISLFASMYELLDDHLLNIVSNVFNKSKTYLPA